MARKRLKSGFTTGAAAAAAVKGALHMLVHATVPDRVFIPFLSQGGVEVEVRSCEAKEPGTAVCTVVKDAGDDPDITHKAEIGARVTLLEPEKKGPYLVITGGKGVGTVTRPGLEVPVGEPAINRGPKEMIRQAVAETTGEAGSVHVEIFVPQGEILAEKTLNSRLGIIGGISILGTTGIVRPMSHDAYIATIESGIRVACASNTSPLVFTTGRRSERYAQKILSDLPETAFIQIGDFFKASLDIAGSNRVPLVILAVFFGKAVKMACGVPHTHAAESRLALETLARWSAEWTGKMQFENEIAGANTARHAFDIIKERCPPVLEGVGRKVLQAAEAFALPGTQIHCMMLDYDGGIVFDSTREKDEP
ncbi:MAG: cobalt-precorrin-5B (C(1))-methyltransferase CbiD [Desulfarculaceae bacterium]|nr:cobalt-precorrin-5B (C(1))-methyltransferase CbiD [Desulfarculaceae bacterium]